MYEIRVKSVANNRVRLKSDIFLIQNNIEIITKEFNEVISSFRVNHACKSLVFRFDNIKTTLDEILERLHLLFPNTSLPAIDAINNESYCSSCSSCSSCSLTTHDNKPWKRKLIEFGVLTGYAIYIFVAENILGLTIVATPFSLVAVVSMVAAIPLLKEAYVDVKNKRLTLHSFMSFTLLLAIFGGEATAAFEIIYILRGGMLLEEYLAEKSKKEIHNLIELDVKKAYILLDEVELEVDLDEVKEGDIVVSRSGEKIPVDGFIVDGSAEIDEALINGRSEPALKQKNDEVFANTLVQKGRIYIKVSATGANTYISRIISKVENSLSEKSPSELAADRLASRLLKLGTILTAGTYIVTGSALRAFSVMIVMSCPCATVLAASTAISAGIAKGAKENILIKGGEYLEKVSQAEVFCFDKTGTLTTGKPIVNKIYLSENVDEKTLFEYATLAEYRNTHPIAKAILEHAKTLGVVPSEYWHCDIIPGLGVKAIQDKEVIFVGNKKLLNNHKISVREFENQATKALKQGDTVAYVANGKEVLGFISFKHEVRDGTIEMVKDLRERGVEHIVLLTGDDEKVAQSFAQEYNFDEVYSNLMPEGKATQIEELQKKYKNVVMVGDGVNDTFAMSKADVAISFACGGSEAAIEVSNIAITDSNPQDIVKLYDLSKQSLRVVEQNYWIGTGTNLIGVGLAGVGLLSPVAAGAIHIGHTVGIMANSSKIALKKVPIENNYQ